MRLFPRRVAGAAAFVVLIAAGAFAGEKQKAPKVGLSLHASVEAVAPAQPFEIGIQFDIPEPFHIYWENPGDSGMTPKVTWSVPPGFKISPLRFPAPKAHETAGLTTYVLEGTPVLLATVQPPPDLKVGQPVRISAKVAWLVCDEACFRQDGSAEIKLASAAAPKPAADDKDGSLMAIAARKVPIAATQAKYATLKASASKATVAQGDTFEIVFDVAVKPGYHVQSNKPKGETFIPAMVFPRVVAGFTPAAADWPPARVRHDAQLKSDVSEFTGQFQVRLPIKVEGPTAAENVVQSGVFLYQACDDKGRCFPPEALEWSVPLKSTSVHADAGLKEEPYVTELATLAPMDDIPPEGLAAADELAPTGYLDRAQRALDNLGLLGRFIGAFIGGLILNIMPCVLPVISIKILSFVQQGRESPGRVVALGLSFAAGIIVSFWAIVAVIVAIKAGARTVSWGLLFQDTRFVVGMAIAMFVFGLNLFGVFEIALPGAATSKLAGVAEREGLPGAFLKGVFATLLATPCTAPFLASAISYALSQPLPLLFGLFTAAGLGMAAPYILLSARPGWMKYMPKPGTWMITFKQFTGFLLIGAVIWLLWIVGAMRGESAVIAAVCFLGFLALAAWLYGKIEFGWSGVRKGAMAIVSLGILLFGARFSYGMYTPPPPSAQYSDISDADIAKAVDEARWSGETIPWAHYKPRLADALAARGYTVYVDYTAAWCLTCQANKKLVLSTAPIRGAMAAKGVIPIKADFTNPDDQIAEDLKRFQRDAVPLNVVYPAGSAQHPIVLPVILTAKIVQDALEKAGPSRSALAAQ